MAQYTAESERLWLQPLSVENHLEDYHAHVSDPRSFIWSLRVEGESKSIEESERMMKSRIPPSENPCMENYAVLLKPVPSNDTNKVSKPKMIGVVGTPRSTPQAIEVGYTLNPNYWGKGYATEAMDLFIKQYWAPERKETTKDAMIAEVDTDHPGSESVVKKLGFTKGEVLEEKYQLGSDFRNNTGVWRQSQLWHLARPKE